MKNRFDPKLLLFLSVDIIHSTQYKQTQKEETHSLSWLPFFTGFYKNFPLFLNQSFTKEKETLTEKPASTKTLEPPILWKSLGDELIFSAQLYHSKHALLYISAFREAIRKYEKNIKKRNLNLHLKATAWLAGFPVGNAEIVIQAESFHNKIDYIGPLMDIGFRLT